MSSNALPRARSTAAPTTTVLTAAALVVGGLLVAPAAGAAEAPATPRRSGAQIQYVSWGTGTDFLAGRRGNARVSGDAVVIGKPKVRRVHGRKYRTGTWTSPWVTPGFDTTQIIPSWEATTTGDAFVRVQLRARGTDGAQGTWDTLADWALDNPKVRRTTFSGQSDDLGKVNVDTWQAASTVTAWQVRVVLMSSRKAGSAVTLERIGAVASAPRTTPTTTSAPGAATGVVLPVPAYSQMTHKGHYPQWGGGGEAWCSPTSTAMVLAAQGHVPTPVGVRNDHPDAVVDHTARLVYDHGYRGTGNWAFNTAYAATLAAGDSYVTRMADLAEAETYIAQGIPLVLSIAFGRGQLSGAPISASNGHLVVLVGFDAAGNPVVNDPAGATNAAVRRTYDRAQLERIWLTASNGTAYVIRSS